MESLAVLLFLDEVDFVVVELCVDDFMECCSGFVERAVGGFDFGIVEAGDCKSEASEYGIGGDSGRSKILEHGIGRDYKHNRITLLRVSGSVCYDGALEKKEWLPAEKSEVAA